MNAPRLSVSVIVPAYRHAEFIIATIESVLAQAVPPLEVIVVDDGSPDDTALRVAPYAADGRIRYLRQQNAGMATARNVGASLARGDYLYFLDDDDLLFPDALSWMVAELDQNREVGMVFGESVVFTGPVPPKPTYSGDAQPVDRTAFMLFNQLGSPGQVLIRRSAFEAIRGFDTTIWGTDDWDLWLKLLELYPARLAHRPVVAYRLHEQNASRNVARMFNASLRVATRHLRNFPAAQRAILRRYNARRLRQYHAPRLQAMAVACAGRGEFGLSFDASVSWTRSWAHELSSYALLKAQLLRRGRWSLLPDEPLAEVIVQHCGPL